MATVRCIGRDEKEADAVKDIRLDHVVIAVSDWERSIDFYCAVVGAEVIDRGRGRVCFRIGETQLNVHGRASTRRPTWPASRCAPEIVISAFAGTVRSRKLLRTLVATRGRLLGLEGHSGSDVVGGPSAHQAYLQ